MKKFSAKSALLFAAAMAACAFALPSMASAASWGVVGSEHTLDSPNFGYTSAVGGGVTSICGESSLTGTVDNASVLTITAATFRRCTISSPILGNCTETWVATSLPWRATAISTTTIQIHGIHLDSFLEDEPGFPGSCNAAGVGLTHTGTLRSGIHWTANQREMLFDNAEGMTLHSVLGNNSPETRRGTLRDTQQTLTVAP